MDNKPLIAIVGPSGSGKSSSLESLDPLTTRIFDIEQKGFPWRVNGSAWEKSIIKCADTNYLEYELKKLLAKPGEVKTIVIESFTKYVEMLSTLCQLTKSGYDVWKTYNQSVTDMLNLCKQTNVTVIWTAIPEIVKIPQTDASEKACARIKVQGKQWEGCIEKEFLIVLYTEPRMDKNGKMEYNFVTNSDGINSAKSPRYLELALRVPNNLKDVLVKLG